MLVLGAKNQFTLYDAAGLIQASQNKMVFVSGNYRLGAFGWLAGTTVEKEATPNAGLWGRLT